MTCLCPHERIIIIEDTGEIQCAARNAVLYHTTAAVTMTALLKTTMRMRPDRILVGEVRGAEAHFQWLTVGRVSKASLRSCGQ